MAAIKVGLITGGASGFGLAVARSLASQGYKLSILDMNQTAGETAASELGANFHRVNVTNYDQQAAAFASTFKEHGRLDFVFANAGIAMDDDWYAPAGEDASGIPKPPSMRQVDINISGAIYSSWLAQQYFRRSEAARRGGHLVITASCGGIYPVPNNPIYAAGKHAMVGLTRSLAPRLLKEGIRVNAICPGPVKTNLVSKEIWDPLGADYFVPVEKVVEAVNTLNDDQRLTGKAVEIGKYNFYYHDAPKYSDEYMAGVMKDCD